MTLPPGCASAPSHGLELRSPRLCLLAASLLLEFGQYALADQVFFAEVCLGLEQAVNIQSRNRYTFN